MGIQKGFAERPVRTVSAQDSDFRDGRSVSQGLGTTTHYFCAVGRNLNQGDEAVSQGFRFDVENAFKGEYAPMIAEIQKRMGSRNLFDLKPLLLSMDKFAVLARGRATELLKQEASRVRTNISAEVSIKSRWKPTA